MRIIFAGTPEFAVPSLKLLLTSEEIADKHEVCAVYTQPDRPSGRGRKLQFSPVKELALSAEVPVFQPDSLKVDSEIKHFSELQPDLMVVVAYGMILPQAILDIPKYGCINVHGSLLPRWRGAAPIQRSLMAGDEKTGVTIMRIIHKLDAGDMLHKEEYAISNRDTSEDLYNTLSELGAVGLAKVINQLESGTLQAEMQDENLVTNAEKLTKSEAELDWTQPADVLDRKIRGLNPWPVAQTLYDDQILRIWRSEPLISDQISDQIYDQKYAPGTILCTNKSLDVVTGDGLLRLHEVQLPGGKRLPIQAFLNSHQAQGKKLG
ncbi:MAG: methionyl-tRNA formyltransferase [Methylococcaceae bacterium]|nr:methionyl-tRNA formyltransferase [Methylococcaceae bacterium]